MPFRSSDARGNIAIPANAAIVGYRIVPDIHVADALEVFAQSEAINEFAAAVRRHPSWNTRYENDLRWQPDPEWTTEEIRFAREVLIRALRAFGPQDHSGLTRLRSDGRRELADHSEAEALACPLDDWCILDTGHPGHCNEEREVWAGPDALYPTAGLVTA